uniref:Uncharacterized protein n=1 Tax=Oryza sativa subsp. japonica TaxID=39947 RepID=Q7F7Z1_ORYSJ|nr:unnamed protein product [Oryza sativa Japonica Group]
MTTDGVGGEETGSRRQSAAEEKKEAARRQSRRRGSTTPRGRGQGRREGEVAPGAPRHAFTLAPAPLVLGDGRRRRERDGRQQSGDGGSATMARWAEAMSVWEGRTDLGGQALGWRQRRFRGRCESGDGVDALGGGGRWIERRKLKRERGLVAWSGQAQATKGWRQGAIAREGKKEGRTVERGTCPFRFGRRRWERECSASGIWTDAGRAAWARAAELAAGSGAERQRGAGADGGGDRVVGHDQRVRGNQRRWRVQKAAAGIGAGERGSREGESEREGGALSRLRHDARAQHVRRGGETG